MPRRFLRVPVPISDLHILGLLYRFLVLAVLSVSTIRSHIFCFHSKGDKKTGAIK
jgi:uncharacterized membrane protein